MSSANESNEFPRGVWYRIAPSDRWTSRAGSRRPGKYQATTAIPLRCAASRNRRTPSGNTIILPRLKFEVSRYNVSTPRAFIRRTAVPGCFQATS
jgi:hypothetical protein